MKYFLHDTSAFDDEKISELFINFGYEGLGLFYTALEKIGKQEKPIKTDVLKSQLRIGKRLAKCWSFIEQIGLISSTNGESFNEQLLNFSEKYQIKKEKTREKVLQWRKKQIDTENVTSYETICNPNKVKKSKVKESKEENIVKFNFKKSLIELGITEQIASDWLKVRSNKKASNTETAFKKIKSEISKSILSPNESIKIAVEKNWTGFEADWIINLKSKQPELKPNTVTLPAMR